MKRSNEMPLLLKDDAAELSSARPVLAGLKATPASMVRRRRRWVSAAAVAVALAVGALGSVVSRGGNRVANAADALPTIPLPAQQHAFISLPIIYSVDRVAVSLVEGIAPVSLAPPVKEAARRNRRQSASPASLDVAVLRVLVEHIDAERRALSRGE